MMDMTQAHLQAPLRGTLRLDEPMAEHVSWRAGGVAERCYVPADLADLELFLKTCAGAVYFVGLGSNLLVRDGGLRGTAILLHGALSHIKLTPQGLIYAEAGVSSPKVASFAARHDLEGAEFLSGIPGTVGGALAMNAGCYEAETKDVLVEAQAVTREGEQVVLTNAEMGFSYRKAAAAAAGDLIFTGALFEGRLDDPAAIMARMDGITAKREATQPIREKTGGSTFKNPPGDSAWRLIDAAGWRGKPMGQAMFSPLHANFLINTGDATAADLEDLGEAVRADVKAQYGVELEWEIKRVGRKA
jgi:UDP-N-acetylmuramate dehydrogenase